MELDRSRRAAPSPSPLTPSILFPMHPTLPPVPPPLLQDPGIFRLAVIIGRLGGVAATVLLGRWLGDGATGTPAIAVAMTCTGAAHAHFVHKQPWKRLVPKVGVGAPLKRPMITARRKM